jgi:ankyrin repeat protein
LACFKGESSCVECLLKHGASYKTHDSVNERTPLHAAAYNNNEECLKAISTYLDVENQSDFKSDLLDKYGRTPLMIAVEQGHLNTISLLITHMNANVLECDVNQRTALHRSAALGYEECCLLILKSNANSAFQKDVNGLMPIHYAVMAGHANLISMFFEYFEECLNPDNSSDINTELLLGEKLLVNEGFSLLHYACFNGHSTCAETICELGQTYRFLIDPLINPDAITTPSTHKHSKFSVLHAACQNSHDACVSFLIEKFSSNLERLIELEDSNGNRPLHICAMNNEYDCALLLLESNCKINERNKFGKTPLMLAACCNSFSIMELLLSEKASGKKVNLNCVDNKGNSCLHLALLNKHENCALFILDKIESNSYLINLQNKDGDTLLHVAASNGYLTCVEILLSKGADIWLKNNTKKCTPLVMCAKNDQVADCLELMLSRLIFMISNGTMNAVNATTSNKTTSNLMMMMMTPANSQTQGANLNGKNNNNNNEDLGNAFNKILGLPELF